jgi:hypothetical protein
MGEKKCIPFFNDPRYYYDGSIWVTSTLSFNSDSVSSANVLEEQLIVQEQPKTDRTQKSHDL